MPWPTSVRDALWVALPSLYVSDSNVETSPVPAGVNVRSTVQLPPAASVAPQSPFVPGKVPPVNANGAASGAKLIADTRAAADVADGEHALAGAAEADVAEVADQASVLVGLLVDLDEADGGADAADDARRGVGRGAAVLVVDAHVARRGAGRRRAELDVDEARRARGERRRAGAALAGIRPADVAEADADRRRGHRGRGRAARVDDVELVRRRLVETARAEVPGRGHQVGDVEVLHDEHGRVGAAARERTGDAGGAGAVAVADGQRRGGGVRRRARRRERRRRPCRRRQARACRRRCRRRRGSCRPRTRTGLTASHRPGWSLAPRPCW